MTRVLLASLGGAPQVITETLWALLQPGAMADAASRARPPEAMDEVVVLATAHVPPRQGSLAARDDELRGRIAALYGQYGLKPPAVAVLNVADAAGRPLDDLRSADDNAAFGDLANRTLAALLGRGARVHLSLAGGRKTMSSYLQAAMMLLGGPEDAMSHVLVAPDELTRCPDFWWPDQPVAEVQVAGFPPPGTAPRRISARAADVRLDLVRIPFVSVAALGPGGRLPAGFSHAGLLGWQDEARAGPPVILDAARCAVAIGSHEVTLARREFAIYAVLALARRDGWQGAGPDGVGPDHAGWVAWAGIADPDGPFRRTLARFAGSGTGLSAKLADIDAAGTATIRDERLGFFRDAMASLLGKVGPKIDRSVANPWLRPAVTIGRSPPGPGRPTGAEAAGARFGLTVEPGRLRFERFVPAEIAPTR